MKDLFPSNSMDSYYHPERYKDCNFIVYDEHRKEYVVYKTYYNRNCNDSLELYNAILEKNSKYNILCFLDHEMVIMKDMYYSEHPEIASWSGAMNSTLEFAKRKGLFCEFSYKKIRKENPIKFKNHNYVKGYVVCKNQDVIFVTQKMEIAEEFVISENKKQYLNKENIGSYYKKANKLKTIY